MKDIYNEDFYNAQKDGSYKSAIQILTMVNNIFPNINKVFDVGCGLGTWLKAWQDIKKDISVFGIDGNNVNDNLFFIPRDCYRRVDLTQNYLDLFKLIGINLENKIKPFDLVQSLEVAEHLDEKYSENFIDILVNLSDIVLFSAAIPYQWGTNHINCQPPEYWAKLFKNKGYVCFDILRADIWENKNIEWWYRQNIMIYVCQDKIEMLNKMGFKECNPKYLIIPEYYEMLGKSEENLRDLVHRIQSHLSYRLAKALVKNPLIFPFKAFNIYKNWKK
ncbi:TPA: class I SAM-dependent methyltransferase [Campylobacter jejuni]|nr:class I SAM-dependent methyltransferase [Campylobacter jejuni]